MHYVYVLKQGKYDYYIGYTKNLSRRYTEHRKYGSWQLLYYEAYGSESLARVRERRLKYYGSAWRALKRRINA